MRCIRFMITGRNRARSGSRLENRSDSRPRHTSKLRTKCAVPSKAWRKASYTVGIIDPASEVDEMCNLRNPTVLLVDDNLDTCDLLRFVFEESGASVIPAPSVEKAVEVFRRCPPHAVI